MNPFAACRCLLAPLLAVGMVLTAPPAAVTS